MTERFLGALFQSDKLRSNKYLLPFLRCRPDLTGPVLDAKSGLHLVSLPSPEFILDQKQAELTQRILDKLGSGLEVGVLGRVVYGLRRGEVKAFWSFSRFDHSRTPREISKLEPQPLYLFKDFIQGGQSGSQVLFYLAFTVVILMGCIFFFTLGILDFVSGRDSPPHALFVCLGEKWPDPDNRPWEKKLITVEVREPHLSGKLAGSMWRTCSPSSVWQLRRSLL